MTSLLRTTKSNLPVTKFVPIKSLTYWDNALSHQALIPFSYKNGVLDINLQDGVNMLLTTTGGGINGGYNGYSGYTTRMVKMMGGAGVVTSLGPNFDIWIRKVIAAEYSLGPSYTGPISIQVAPVMTKVQQNFPGPGQYGGAALYSQNAIQISSEPPQSDEYIVAGDKTNNFFSVWVFRSPLTIMFLNNDVPEYVTLQTQFTNPN